MKKPKKRKVTRFKTVKLKISPRQKRSLENYCRSRGVTPLKMIKMSIKPLLENYASAVPTQPVSPRQLNLFVED